MRGRILKNRFQILGITVALAVIISAVCIIVTTDSTPPGGLADAERPSTEGAVEFKNEPIQPVPQPIGLDPRKIALGERLFSDQRLSADGTMACVSCHRVSLGGADSAAFTAGLNGHPTQVNVPTIWNSRFSVAQFWDGRAATLEDQVDGPLQSPDEMASNWPDVIAKLQADRHDVQDARSIYGAPLSPALVRDAIATYERSLVSLNSRFDAFLRGSEDALTRDEKTGYRLFKDYGCTACHQGIAVGGNMYQRMGLFGDYFGDRKIPETKADLGRFNVTGREADRHVFKVPSLRTVVSTAPYFHDGSAATLEAAIATMARYQLGREMSAKDIALIKGFLATLASEPKDNPR
jgi:cytochrome c peroxidase